MLRVILIDDEPAARSGLARHLLAHPDVHIAGQAESVATARDLLAALPQPPHAVFLDIHMPRSNGFELLSSLTPQTQVIFVTAHAGHAPLAFEVAALDYLLKPVRPARLAQTLDRLRCIALPDLEKSAAPPPLSPTDHLCLHHAGCTRVVPIAHVAALRAEGDFTRILIGDDTTVLISQPLGKYQKIMPQPAFVRVSRSLMVNLHRVESLTARTRDESHLKLRGIDEPLLLRRVAATRLKSLIL